MVEAVVVVVCIVAVAFVCGVVVVCVVAVVFVSVVAVVGVVAGLLSPTAATTTALLVVAH